MLAPDTLILDLQTSGLYLRNMPIDSNQQPWAPYISALQCDGAGTVVNMFSAYIKADNRAIQNGAIGVHGIDQGKANRIGIPEPRALGILSDMLKVGPFDSPVKVVTYGDMDKMVLASLFARFAVANKKPASAYDKLWLTRPLTRFIDLQKPFAQMACAIPSEEEGQDYKWPSFAEATSRFLGREPSPTRDSLHDIVLLKDLYFEFVSQGFIKEEPTEV